MRLFGKRKPQIKGQIGYYGLANWWLSAFTEAERAYIEGQFAPVSGGLDGKVEQRTGSLTQGDITYSTQTVGMFLSGLSTWFKKTEQDRDIARRILKKSVEVTNPKKDIMGLHFTYQALIQSWYRDRDSLPDALDEAIKACQRQIEIAPQAARQWKREYPKQPLPQHVGYKQLTIIYDKQGKYTEAIAVARQAKKQGWNGDWDRRIQRYQKKLGK